MEKRIIVWTIIGVLFLAALFLTFRATSTGASIGAGGKIDTTGWTANELMNYEMHGIIPARASSGGSSRSGGSSGGMVGGC